MRKPRVLGNITSAESKARRLGILRELWLADVPRALIAERLHVDPQTVSWMARQAGLPMRKRRAKTRSLCQCIPDAGVATVSTVTCHLCGRRQM